MMMIEANEAGRDVLTAAPMAESRVAAAVQATDVAREIVAANSDVTTVRNPAPIATARERAASAVEANIVAPATPSARVTANRCVTPAGAERWREIALAVARKPIDAALAARATAIDDDLTTMAAAARAGPIDDAIASPVTASFAVLSIVAGIRANALDAAPRAVAPPTLARSATVDIALAASPVAPCVGAQVRASTRPMAPRCAIPAGPVSARPATVEAALNADAPAIRPLPTAAAMPRASNGIERFIGPSGADDLVSVSTFIFAALLGCDLTPSADNRNAPSADAPVRVAAP